MLGIRDGGEDSGPLMNGMGDLRCAEGPQKQPDGSPISAYPSNEAADAREQDGCCQRVKRHWMLGSEGSGPACIVVCLLTN
jgi:hypothetical protein